MSASDATPELSTLPLVALVTAGLEEPAILEIRERFGLSPGSVQLVGCPPPEDNCTPEAQGGIFAGASGVSKLRFEVPWPADEAALRRSLRSLKGAQGILAPVALATVRFGAEGLLDARAAISDRALWPPVLEAWRVLTERGPPGTAPRSFRCSCVRDGGVHGYTSVQLAAAVGGAVQTLHGWAPSMKEHELEVVALLCAHELLVGVTVGGGSFSRMRLPTEPRPLMPCCDIDARPALLEHLTLTLALTPTLILNPNPGSNPHGLDSNQARLRCSTAWLMLQLARLTPGAVVLDPMAGVGTVPLEAANTASAVLALGGDLEPELVAQAARNAQVSVRSRCGQRDGQTRRRCCRSPPRPPPWRSAALPCRRWISPRGTTRRGSTRGRGRRAAAARTLRTGRPPSCRCALASSTRWWSTSRLGWGTRCAAAARPAYTRARRSRQPACSSRAAASSRSPPHCAC